MTGVEWGGTPPDVAAAWRVLAAQEPGEKSRRTADLRRLEAELGRTARLLVPGVLVTAAKAVLAGVPPVRAIAEATDELAGRGPYSADVLEAALDQVCQHVFGHRCGAKPGGSVSGWARRCAPADAAAVMRELVDEPVTGGGYGHHHERRTP